MSSIWYRLYAEVGLKALLHSPADTKILCLQRLVRLSAYGCTSLILVLYLTSLGISEEKIGLFMTLTLLGDVVISLVLTIIADGIGRRKMLAFGSLLMVASGVIFATCTNYWILVLASVLGVISPSGNEIGPFKAIEESTISHLVPAADRSSIFAWYILLGTTGTAIGAVSGGWTVQILQTHQDLTAQQAYQVTFWAYAALGLVKLGLSLALSSLCERAVTNSPTPIVNGETRPLLLPEDEELDKDENKTPLAGLSSLLPRMSRESSSMAVKLCLLFAIDSVASGLMPGSWFSYFFNRKFALAEGAIGTLFFVGMLVASASNLAAPSLARRIGLIKAMVFTHVPASIALALIPIPQNVILAMALFILRACFNSMDQPPRQAFIAGAVLAEERTAVMGLINVVKTLSQSVGPIFTGILAGHQKLWLAFVIAGAMKLLYDALMLTLFAGYRAREEPAETHSEERADDIEATDVDEEAPPTIA